MVHPKQVRIAQKEIRIRGGPWKHRGTPDGRKGTNRKFEAAVEAGRVGQSTRPTATAATQRSLRRFRRNAPPEKRCCELGFAPGAPYGDAVAKTLYDSAINGRSSAAREIREGIEDRAAERLESAAPKIMNLHDVYDKAPAKRSEHAEIDSLPPTSPENID